MPERSIIIRIEGHPKPQPRARATVIAGHASVYNPSTNRGWRECIAIAAKALRPVKPLEGPIWVDIVFIFPRPKSHFSTGKKGGLARNAPVYWHTKGKGEYGGDRDNCDKTILDVLTQCGFWQDDGQVCNGQPRKRWAYLGERPGALVVITPVEDKEPRGWLSDLDRRLREQAMNEPAPKTQQVIPQAAPVETQAGKERRAFCDLFVTAWMQKHMRKYDFQGAQDAKAAQRIWDACGHDLDFAKRLIAAYMADDRDFVTGNGHSLKLLSAAGVLPRYIAEAQKAARPEARTEPLTTQELYADGKVC